MTGMLDDFRIFEPYPGIFAYYDGRIDGKRLYSEGPNWLDDGAFSLGIASYAIVDDDEALVYDTHISLDHARAIRAHLEEQGVTNITVILSHFHNDHIAGNEVFADYEIIANSATARLLEAEKPRIATRLPRIDPVVMPTSLFDRSRLITVGSRAVELHEFDIHSPDATVLWLPEERILFAGDTLEDTATYMTDAAALPKHLLELRRLAAFPIARILPCHGDPDRIAAGGYEPSFIDATIRYIEAMNEDTPEPEIWLKPLSEAVSEDVKSGAVIYIPAYEDVHASNIALLRSHRENSDYQ
jgi:glyoxylase-like metal-dependent hydrolase (beta-lactamase superfamily II)